MDLKLGLNNIQELLLSLDTFVIKTFVNLFSAKQP